MLSAAHFSHSPSVLPREARKLYITCNSLRELEDKPWLCVAAPFSLPVSYSMLLSTARPQDDRRRIEKNLEGSGCGLIWTILSRNLPCGDGQRNELETIWNEAVRTQFKTTSSHKPGWTVKSHEIPQDCKCTGRDSKRIPTEYKSRTSPDGDVLFTYTPRTFPAECELWYWTNQVHKK
jgi:hypothetical protein